jgi:hypothetical protein
MWATIPPPCFWVYFSFGAIDSGNRPNPVCKTEVSWSIPEISDLAPNVNYRPLAVFLRLSTRGVFGATIEMKYSLRRETSLCRDSTNGGVIMKKYLALWLPWAALVIFGIYSLSDTFLGFGHRFGQKPSFFY